MRPEAGFDGAFRYRSAEVGNNGNLNLTDPHPVRMTGQHGGDRLQHGAGAMALESGLRRLGLTLSRSDPFD